MPGAVCLAASHTEKLKNIRQSALKKEHLTGKDQKLSVMKFEGVADKYDKTMRQQAGEGEGKFKVCILFSMSSHNQFVPSIS